MSAVPLLDQHKGCHCAERRPSIFRRAIAAVRRKPAAPEVTLSASGAAEPPISAPAFRPDQLLGARFDTPDQTGRVIGFEADGDGAFYDDKAAPRFPCCVHCVSDAAVRLRGVNQCALRDNHPVACSDGCNAPVHPVTDPAGIPVLGDRMISEVREQYAPAPWRPVPTFTSTPEAAHAQAMHDLSARYLPAPETIGGYPVTYHRPVNGRNLGTQPRRRVYGEAPQLDVGRGEYLAEEAAEAMRAEYVRSQMRDGMAARDPETLRQVLTGLRKL